MEGLPPGGRGPPSGCVAGDVQLGSGDEDGLSVAVGADDGAVRVGRSRPVDGSVGSPLGRQVGVDGCGAGAVVVGVDVKVDVVGADVGVEVDVVGADVEVDVVGADVEVDVVGADVEVDVVGADVEVDAVGADVEVDAVGADVEVDAVGADVEVDAVGCEVVVGFEVVEAVGAVVGVDVPDPVGALLVGALLVGAVLVGVFVARDVGAEVVGAVPLVGATAGGDGIVPPDSGLDHTPSRYARPHPSTALR